MESSTDTINQFSTGLSRLDTDACIKHLIEQTRTTHDSWIWITFNWIEENCPTWNELPEGVRYQWLTLHYLPALIMQIGEEEPSNTLSDVWDLAEELLSILRSCRRIPDDSPAGVAMMVRDAAADLARLYDVRAYLTALAMVGAWSNSDRYNWNFFAWASGRETSAFESWTMRDWEDIPEHAERVEERIRRAVSVPLLSPLVDGAASNVVLWDGYEAETSIGVGLGPMVTSTDIARIFKAMRDANILTATWEEIAQFVGASSGRALAALALKPNSASPRVVRLLEAILTQCHPDERERFLRLLR